jgi:hypothetical protein
VLGQADRADLGVVAPPEHEVAVGVVGRTKHSKDLQEVKTK